MIEWLIGWLVEPFALGFMQRGLLAAIVVGVLCAVVGCYVTLRSLAFMGDALAHAILPGVALAYLLGANLLVGALAAAVVVALGIGAISRRGDIKEDTAIGILFSAALSLGVVLISATRASAADLTHILFGNVLAVSPADLRLTVGLAAAALATIALLYRPFLLISFDPTLAATRKLPARRLNDLMLALIALTVVISMQTVGVGLAAAMLITPAATAYLLARRLPAMMAIAAGLGALAAVCGLYLSYYADVASGAAIVLAAGAFFLAAYAWSAVRRRRA